VDQSIINVGDMANVTQDSTINQFRTPNLKSKNVGSEDKDDDNQEQSLLILP
jgi:hypothetical protein